MNLDAEQKELVQRFMDEYKEDEATAMRFLMGRKWDYERTQELFQNNREVVKKYGFEWVQMFDVREELTTQKLYCPGGKDKNGAALMVLDGSKHLPGEYSIESTLKLAFWLGGRLTRDLQTQVNGVTIIVDLTNAKWANFDSRTQRTVVEFFTNNIPARIKNILIYRPPWWVSLAVRIVKPFLKPKMRERIQLVDQGDLTTWIDNSQLPAALGGALDYDHGEWMRQEQAKEEQEALPASHQTASEGGALALIPADRRELLQGEREKTMRVLDLKIKEHEERLQTYSTPFDLYRLLGDRQTRLQVDLDTLPQVEPNRQIHEPETFKPEQPTITSQLNVSQPPEQLAKEVEQAIQERYGEAFGADTIRRRTRRSRPEIKSPIAEEEEEVAPPAPVVEGRRRRRHVEEEPIPEINSEQTIITEEVIPEQVQVEHVETVEVTKPVDTETPALKHESRRRTKTQGRRTRLDANVIDLEAARAYLAQQNQ